MGKYIDDLTEDLAGIDAAEVAKLFRAVHALTPQQVSGMMGWAQQHQDATVHAVAYWLHYGSQEQAKQWFERELAFADNTRDLTPELLGRLDDIMPDRPPTAEQYEAAAQMVACYRKTCNGEHNHYTFGPVQGPAEGPDDAPNPWGATVDAILPDPDKADPWANWRDPAIYRDRSPDYERGYTEGLNAGRREHFPF